MVVLVVQCSCWGGVVFWLVLLRFVSLGFVCEAASGKCVPSLLVMTIRMPPFLLSWWDKYLEKSFWVCGQCVVVTYVREHPAFGCSNSLWDMHKVNRLLSRSMNPSRLSFGNVLGELGIYVFALNLCFSVCFVSISLPSLKLKLLC